MEKDKGLLILAKNDKEVSELLLATTNDEVKQNIAAFHTQQAVEKILKFLKVDAGGNAGIDHNIAVLAKEAAAMGIEVPPWVQEGAYNITSWATTIRYNVKFKSDRDMIKDCNEKVNKWLAEIEAAGGE